MRFGSAALAHALAATLRRGAASGSAFAQQSALLRTASGAAWEAPRLHWSLRALRIAGVTTGAAIVVLPVGAVGALLIGGLRNDADAHVLEMFGSLPRTLRVLWWSIWAAYNYKVLAAAFAAATITEQTYRLDLADLHRRAAARLLLVCQKNGEFSPGWQLWWWAARGRHDSDA